MRVQVKYHLAPPAIDVDEKTIPRLGHSQIEGNLFRHVAHVGDEVIPARDVVQRGNVPARNDQHMDRRSGPRIPEGHGSLILVNLPSRKLASNYLTENAFFHRSTGLPPIPRYQMRVKVKDNLAAAAVNIYEKPVPRLGHSEILGNTRGYLSDVRENVVARGHVVQGRDMLPGHYKNVEGRCRMSVPERYNQIIFVYMICGPFALDYVAKDTVGGRITHTFHPELLNSRL